MALSSQHLASLSNHFTGINTYFLHVNPGLVMSLFFFLMTWREPLYSKQFLTLKNKICGHDFIERIIEFMFMILNKDNSLATGLSGITYF